MKLLQCERAIYNYVNAAVKSLKSLAIYPKQKVKHKQRTTSRRKGKQFNSLDSRQSSSSGLTEIPKTSFRCSEQPFPGLYADVEANCQV